MEQSKFYQIKNITEQEYTLVGCDGSVITRPIQDVDRLASVFTIQDAKDGDVLAVTMYPEGTWIGIFKEQNGCTFSSHCFVNTEGTFKLGTYNHGNGEAIHPATKEQRDTLLKAMADAGYTFDFEKKELKKIGQKYVEWSEEDEEEANYIADFIENLLKKEKLVSKKTMIMEEMVAWLRDIKYRYLPKPEQGWGEEDEKMIRALVSMCDVWATSHQFYPKENKEMEALKTWLKSFKDRIQPQPNQEWSEEDERNASYICAALDCYYRLREDRNNTNGQEDLDKARNWLYNRLKSLRPQSTWKPSEEQLRELRCVISGCSFETPILVELEEQLKKL